ncbi:MAG TPA: hypothetical protein VHP13_08095 [Gammaproteobacteria bacterium]|nr:hypothetical protein [Gammaproteobacteria bacterium]
MAQSDTAYPKDLAEFQAMDGFGMMVVAAISHDKDELPPKRVYAVVGGKQVELHMVLGSFVSSSGSPQVQKTIGPYRWNGLYDYPVYLSAEASDLQVDFAKGRNGFSLGLPPELPAYLKAPIPHPRGSEPPTQAALELLRREYPGMFVPVSRD